MPAETQHPSFALNGVAQLERADAFLAVVPDPGLFTIPAISSRAQTRSVV
jgi:hypothetical protein